MMKANSNRRPVRSVVRYGAGRPAPPARRSVTGVNAHFEELKRRLLQAYLTGDDAPTVALARRAALDAAAVAWLTPFPLLALPELLGEKLAAAREQARRQAAIRRRSQALLALSA